MESYGSADRKLNRLPAEYRQCARQSEANGAHIRVRGRSKFDRTATEYLRFRAELDVHLETDHRLVFGQNAFSNGGGGHVLIVRIERRQHDRIETVSTRNVAVYVNQICLSPIGAVLWLLLSAVRPWPGAIRRFRGTGLFESPSRVVSTNLFRGGF